MSALEPMTEDWMNELLAMIEDAYPFLGNDAAARRRKTVTWLEELDDLHRTDVAASVKAWTNHSAKPPSIADVRAGAVLVAKKRAEAERSNSFLGRESTYRCPKCKDTGWIELDEAATVVDRCPCQPKDVLARYHEMTRR
mgnify:CR=1 FL=1